MVRGVPRSRWRLAVVLLVVAVGLVVTARPVSAHTELERSSPADGETVDAAVDAITLDFTAAVSPVEDGYQVLDPQGQIRRPDAVDQPAPDQIRLRFTTPLAGGDVGVLWSVTASDGHLIEGGYRFTVDAPAPTTTTASPTTTTRPPITTTTTRPEPAPTTTSATTVPPTETTEPPGTTGPTATTEPTETTEPELVVPTTVPPTTTTTAVPISIEDFLGRSMSSPSELTGRRVAQVAGVLGSLLAVGWLAIALVLAPGRPVGRTMLGGALAAGVALSLAAVLEATTQAGLILDRGLGLITDPVTIYETLSGEYLIALVLRLVGGLVLATGAAALRIRSGRGTIALAAAGAAAVVLSFTFDGHTVSKGNRAVQFVADVVHVAAGAWWLAGVVALVWWAWRRWRLPTGPGDDGFLLALLRFSAYGGWALLALTLAGGVMTLGIIDGPGDLTGTTWGRVLLFKLAATALAVAIAGYHRWVLIPAVRDRPDDPVGRERVTDALAAEGFLLVLVAVLAGVLVGSMI